MQPRFIKWLFALTFVIALTLPLESDTEDERPDRRVRPPAMAVVSASPLPLPEGTPRLGGLWELSSTDPRFGALSGLAWNEGRLLAVTDAGAVVAWRPPGGPAFVRDLPDGPGPPQWKINRDAEAITPDLRGRGWWVAFEQHHGAWLFDPRFERALGHRPVRLRTWWRNWGVEAAVSLAPGLLLLAEEGDEAILLSDEGERRYPVEMRGAIADAARVPGSGIVVARREVRPWGIGNSLAWLEGSETLRTRDWLRLPLGRWDNVEGLAIEPRPGGRHRLWFVTDNDRSRRTLLGWVELGERGVDRSVVPPKAGTSAKEVDRVDR